ncbi:MAG: hypothetical protein GC193_08670 [Cryomorphaceae bacterium]|nr:hypothetical protein [Cryomorphaceae bacterium]
MIKRLFHTFVFILLCTTSIGQSDGNNYLFKEPKIRFQWDIGKSYFTHSYRSNTTIDYNLIGNTVDFVGIVVKNRLNISVGGNFVTSTPQKFEYFDGSDTSAVRMLDYGNFYFKLEPLVFNCSGREKLDKLNEINKSINFPYETRT